MFRSIYNTLGNCFKIPELKSRILFTIMLLAVCRLTAFIVIPGIDGQALAKFFNEHSQGAGGMLTMYNTFAGGALGNCAVGALGIMPYLSTAFSGFNGQLVMIENHFLYYFVTVTVMTAGTMLLMWLGEQITERGIGNGVSLVITIGILARLP